MMPLMCQVVDYDIELLSGGTTITSAEDAEDAERAARPAPAYWQGWHIAKVS